MGSIAASRQADAMALVRADPRPARVGPVTAIDDRSAALAEAAKRERDAYLAGRADGYREAEADMAAHWGTLARSIQRRADRIRGPIPEPRVRDQHDDSIWFTAEEWANWAADR